MNDLIKLATNRIPAKTPTAPIAKPVKEDPTERRKHYTKRRARLNIIPDSEELSRLIDRALTALSKGIYWDRGSIINIVL